MAIRAKKSFHKPMSQSTDTQQKSAVNYISPPMKGNPFLYSPFIIESKFAFAMTKLTLRGNLDLEFKLRVFNIGL